MQTVQFGIFFFVFLLTESFINEQAATVCNEDAVNYIYAIGLLFTASGYLLFSFLKKGLKGKNILIIGGAIVVLEVCISVIHNPFLFLVASYICLLSLGYMGGYLHCLMGLRIQNAHFATNLGIVCMLGIVLQYIVQNIVFFRELGIFTIVCAVIVVTLLSLIVGQNAVAYIDEDCADMPVSGISIETRTVIYVIAVVIMSIILGIQDSIVVGKNANGEISLFSYVRLFYALGLFIAGIVADIKKRIYMPLASGLAMILSVLAISFMDNKSVSYNISMAVMYFYSGFYVMFLTIMFMELGYRRRNMSFYAGLGRVARSITTSIVIIITTLLSNHVSVMLYIVISCCLCIGLIIAMALSGVLMPEKTIIREIEVKGNEKSFEERLYDIYELYSLTQKEREVFEKLVTSEMGVQDIADEMGISRRVLQRHIASIYEKTSTKTRVGLLMLLNK